MGKTKEVTIGGQTHPFKLNMKALLYFQKDSKTKLEDLGNMVNEPEKLEGLIYAGLKEGARASKVKLSIEQADVLDCTMQEFTALMEAVTDSIQGPNIGTPKKKDLKAIKKAVKM